MLNDVTFSSHVASVLAISINMYVCMEVCMCICICVYVCMYVCIYLCTSSAVLPQIMRYFFQKYLFNFIPEILTVTSWASTVLY